MKRFGKRFKSYRAWRYGRKMTPYAQRVIRLHKAYTRRPLKQLLALRRPILGQDLSVTGWVGLKSQEMTKRYMSLKVLSMIKKGKSLRSASREFGLRPETAKKHIRSAIQKRGGRWIAKGFDKIERRMNIYENGQIKSIVVTNSKDASLIGEYFNDVKKALATGNESILKKYKGKIIVDSEGNEHTLETRLEKIYEIVESKEDPEFFEIYEA